MTASDHVALKALPTAWQRLGVIVERGSEGAFDSSVTGDPCVVWDEDRQLYHMVYFAQKHVEGKEVNCNGHAVSLSNDCLGPGAWQKLGPITFTNPDALGGHTHKPWILMDPYKPATAVRIDGNFWLFTVSFHGSHKVIQLATAPSLDGPWVVSPKPVVDLGEAQAFDSYHVDGVTAYWFSERDEILILYMGYPQQPQVDQPHSPWGTSNAAAVMRPGDEQARKIGTVLRPSAIPGHWTAGYIGGLQIFPAAKGGWYGLINASPTPPVSVEEEPEMREPAPSLGGWAYSPEAWPVSGWQAENQPIEWLDDIPQQAITAGEGVNLWRHHMVIMPDRSLYLLYNTGSYGQERMFGRFVAADQSPVVFESVSSSQNELLPPDAKVAA